MVHVHIALWIVGAPRIDKVLVPESEQMDFEEVDWEAEDQVILNDGEAATVLATFYDRAYTEYNTLKDPDDARSAAARGRRSKLGKTLERGTASPDMLSEAALQVLLDGHAQEEDAAWANSRAFGERRERRAYQTPTRRRVRDGPLWESSLSGCRCTTCTRRSQWGRLRKASLAPKLSMNTPVWKV